MKTSEDTIQQYGLPACCSRNSTMALGHEQNTESTRTVSNAEITLSISGMTCGSCISKVQSALCKINGVQNAQVSLADATCRVLYDDNLTNFDEMASALEAVGYKAGKAEAVDSNAPAPPANRLARPLLYGIAAGVAVIAFYLGLNTLTADWSFAVYQFSQYGGWVVALALGLSLQVGLFARMRAVMAGLSAKGAGKGIAASGSMSGVAMALCCSHYLATILPAIGLSFLSGAVAGLAQYQTTFFIIGVASNILGLTYMLRLMMKNGMLSSAVAYR